MAIDKSGESFESDNEEKANKRKAGVWWIEAIQQANLTIPNGPHWKVIIRHLIIN